MCVKKYYKIGFNKMRGYCFILAFVILIATLETYGVRIEVLHVPLGASHEAPLDCRYDLEGSLLYDVKWYKDGQQFFRCQPDGTVQTYRANGIKVYHSGIARVGTCPLTLTSLSPDSAGEYKCEVTTEGPSFSTAVSSARFRFIQASPRVNIENQNNDIGDNFRGSISYQTSAAEATKGHKFILLLFGSYLYWYCNYYVCF